MIAPSRLFNPEFTFSTLFVIIFLSEFNQLIVYFEVHVVDLFSSVANIYLFLFSENSFNPVFLTNQFILLLVNNSSFFACIIFMEGQIAFEAPLLLTKLACEFIFGIICFSTEVVVAIWIWAFSHAWNTVTCPLPFKLCEPLIFFLIQ